MRFRIVEKFDRPSYPFWVQKQACWFDLWSPVDCFKTLDEAKALKTKLETRGTTYRVVE